MSTGPSVEPYSLLPVSSSALEFIEAGRSLAQGVLGDTDVLTVHDARSKGISLEECQFEHRTVAGISLFLGCCPSTRAVLVLEVLADAPGSLGSDLPNGLRYGMSTSEVIERLGVPSGDGAQIAGLQGIPSG
jgi:hypothetical protein